MLFTAIQTPSDSPWTESPDVKVDDSSVLGYPALTLFEDWARDVAPLMGLEFDQATLFSGSVLNTHLYDIERGRLWACR